jgi:hypothetical protein
MLGMEAKEIAEYAHDLQVGLSRTSIPEFEQLPLIGMAGIVALHIRGLGEIEYGALKYVAEYHFDIPAMVLRQVLTVLAEVEYAKLLTEGTTVKKVIPAVPHFDSVYAGLGEYIGSQKLTEHEQVSVAILSELSAKPEKRDALLGRLGAGAKVFSACERIVTQGGLVLSKRARGQDILVSPAYFTDNLTALADMAAAGGAKRVEKLLHLLKQSQGWPLSMIEGRKEIAGTKLDDHEVALLRQLVGDGILKPPSIRRPHSKKAEHFVFTPRPSNVRLNASNREIYERAMGLVAAVRKGQLLPEAYRIRSPAVLLAALRDRQYLRTNSEAGHQYRNLVTLNVGTLKHTHGDRYEFHLIDTEENRSAVGEAISLVSTGEMDHGAVNKEAQILLTQGEQYVQSVIAAKNYRTINSVDLLPEARHEVEQMLLNLK